MRTRVGYTGGKAKNPTYESVCRGDGHTEGIKVEFDPSIVSYETLLENHFWRMAGLPSSKGKCQYKTAIWCCSEEHFRVAKESVECKQSTHNVKLKVPVAMAGPWTDAEEYHQHYFDKRQRTW